MVCAFRPGDWVRALKNSGGQAYLRGEVYRVARIGPREYGNMACIYTQVDSNGSTTNGWCENNFELAQPPTALEIDIRQYIDEEMKGLHSA